MRSSGQGGKAGTQTGRTPCLPPRLPEWVPMTLCDVSQPEWFVAKRIRSAPDLAPSPLTAPRTSSSEHRRGVGGQRRPKGATPATVQVTTLTRGVYQGRGPPLPSRAGSGRAPAPNAANSFGNSSTPASVDPNRGRREYVVYLGALLSPWPAMMPITMDLLLHSGCLGSSMTR
jgi:hypothetical protein